MTLRGRHLLLITSVALLPSCGGGGSDTPTTPATPVAGCATEAVANEGWTHVSEGSPITYRHNPPASGNHYPVWARYEEHAVPVARGYWVHNLEHGGIVFLYKPGTPAATVDALRAAYRALPNDPACGHKRALLAADPDLPGETAVVAADFVLQSGCTDGGAIRTFVNTHIGRGPEQVCQDGTRP
jgi:uncharacterized protein DUF3105